VLYDILTTLAKIVAPVLAVTADEVWQCMHRAGWVSEASIHLAGWPVPSGDGTDDDRQQRWSRFRVLRGIVMKALEEQRAKGVIGSPLEAQVILVMNDQALRRDCEAHRATLAEVYVVSAVEVQADGATASASEMPGLVGVRVERAAGQKCQRCWKHLTSVGSQPAHPSLCERCAEVVTSQPQRNPS